MKLPELGILQEVDLRRAWPHEALSFTPWLAFHLDTLSREIGIPLELEGQEVAVESFSADILARNAHDDSLVLIENQLAVADHTHLGQIMTYLAGLDAQTVVWIAQEFRDAHLSAVGWLNEHTEEDFAFFAVKVRVVQIGDSPLAPVFEVLVKPNRWEKQLHTVVRETQSRSEIVQRRGAFWTHYLERYPEDGRDGVAGGASNRWRTVGDIVISYCFAVDSVGLFMRGRRGTDSDQFHQLLEPYADILSQELDLPFLDKEGKHTDFGLWQQADTADREQWDVLADWLHENVERYEKALLSITDRAQL